MPVASETIAVKAAIDVRIIMPIMPCVICDLAASIFALSPPAITQLNPAIMR